MKYYDSAASVLKSHFYGNRYEGNLSLSVCHANVGVTGMVARHSGGFTIGYGATFALDAIPFNIGFSLNKGVTAQSFYQLNTINNIFNSWW
jgi:hypothetical protein